MNYTKEQVAISLEKVKSNLATVEKYIEEARELKDYQGVAALFQTKLTLEQTVLAGEFQLQAIQQAEQKELEAQKENANKQPN